MCVPQATQLQQQQQELQLTDFYFDFESLAFFSRLALIDFKIAKIMLNIYTARTDIFIERKIYLYSIRVRQLFNAHTEQTI